MGMPRLGELLLAANAITPEQLQYALKAQQRHGGRLGTNLVELGFLSETALARTLSAQLKLPAVSAAALEKAPPDATAILSPDSAAHHRAVPVRLEGGMVWMAMSDPSDSRAIAELEAATGRTVRPMIAPDVLISYALERHYGVIPRRRSIVEHVAESVRESQRDRAAAHAAPLDLRIEPSSTHLPAPAPPPPTPFKDPYTPAERAAMELRIQDLDFRETNDKIRLGPIAIGARLVAAASQRDVLETAMAFLVQDFRRLVVLVVRSGRLAGFLADGKIDQQALLDFSSPVADIPVISKVLADGRPRLGRASAQTLAGLVKVVGAPGDRAVLLMPVRCAGEPVACIVAVEGRDGVEGWIDEYVQVCSKLDLTLQMLLLRKRIMEG